MALTPIQFLWETQFPSLRDSMDKLFEDFFSHSGFPVAREGQWLPAADIHETKKDIVVTFDIPAIDPKELTISIMENRLTIRGEKKREQELSDEECCRSERFYGSFERVIQLPAEVVAAKAKATYKDGVLKITVPKSQKAAPREIKIEIE